MLRLLTFVVSFALCFSATALPAGSDVTVPERDFDFGRVLKGAIVEHAFVLSNTGNTAIKIDEVRLTRSLTLITAPSSLTPGSAGVVRVRLDTSNLNGLFEGRVEVSTADANDRPIALTFSGTVYETVEAAPRPALFVVTERGRAEEQSLDLINHEALPVEIKDVRFPHDRFSIHVATIEPGRRYRLTLRLDGTGPGGRQRDQIEITTSSPTTPVVKIVANTFVRERVYTFPEVVDLGHLPIRVVNAGGVQLERFAQTLMVYRKGTDRFEVGVTSDLDALDIRAERGPLGDRWQLTIALKRDLKAGPVKGSILIETNDPQFPLLRIPVIGMLSN